MPKLKVLDIFSGIGGFSLGLERAGGFETKAFCEIDPFCRRVLANHWPEVPCYDDIRTLTAERLGADGIAVDIIAGGFPCQDISVGGSGAGLAGERSGLWREYARIIGELRPRFAVVENVGALAFRGLARVLGDLSSLGFDARWEAIPASYIGAPQRRDRIWIVAYAARPGLEGWRVPPAARQTQRNIAGRTLRAGASWPDAPGIPRVGYGLPDWAHRIRALGNAVVPQIPELIGRAIMEAA